jgi:RNA polymerase sigma factor for flagellar operon FliA
MIKLIENDYAVIRKFEGRSSLRTFISTVVANAFKDYRIHQLGKFRPSPEAKRLGACAKELDLLLHRDQRTMEEAIPILLARYPKETRETLYPLAQRLPGHNARPRPVDITNAANVPAADEAEEKVLAGERREKSRRLSRVLGEAIKKLSKVDRQMLGLHFKFGMTVAEISRSLRIEQKLLYPRMTKLKEGLREAAERAGFGPDDIAELIGQEGLELDFGLGTPDVGSVNDKWGESRDDSDDSDDTDDDEP